MNKRKSKKKKSQTYLLCGQYIYIKYSEWNRVKNKGMIKQRKLMSKKLEKIGRKNK